MVFSRFCCWRIYGGIRGMVTRSGRSPTNARPNDKYGGDYMAGLTTTYWFTTDA